MIFSQSEQLDNARVCMQNLGLIEETKVSRSLPWRRPTNVFRVKEDVRPIFWYACELLRTNNIHPPIVFCWQNIPTVVDII